jgi:RNA polymerase sigma-70 factor (ECF subfamily)
VTLLNPDTEELVQRARDGDQHAGRQLLTRHQVRLRQMVAVRLDRRLQARFDPSDVVQEAMIEAHAKLGKFLSGRPVPFYPWLRAIAWQRLLKLQRRHLHARKRSVLREVPNLPALSDESALALADRLAAIGSTPSDHVLLDELRRRVQEALGRLSASDRELLVLRYLEQMPAKEIACVLETTEGAVKTRHVRALQRMRVWLNREDLEGQS